VILRIRQVYIYHGLDLGLNMHACPVWSPYTKRNIRALEQVQRKATRFIVGKELNYNERL
jgi:hypothetical protein